MPSLRLDFGKRWALRSSSYEGREDASTVGEQTANPSGAEASVSALVILFFRFTSHSHAPAKERLL
jgi:hypothetical protein